MFSTSSNKRNGVISQKYWAPYSQKDGALHIRCRELRELLAARDCGLIKFPWVHNGGQMLGINPMRITKSMKTTSDVGNN